MPSCGRSCCCRDGQWRTFYVREIIIGNTHFCFIFEMGACWIDFHLQEFLSTLCFPPLFHRRASHLPWSAHSTFWWAVECRDETPHFNLFWYQLRRMGCVRRRIDGNAGAHQSGPNKIWCRMTSSPAQHIYKLGKSTSWRNWMCVWWWLHFNGLSFMFHPGLYFDAFLHKLFFNCYYLLLLTGKAPGLRWGEGLMTNKSVKWEWMEREREKPPQRFDGQCW